MMMTRRTLKLGVFLLLGAIVNIAVAWGCLWLPLTSGAMPEDFAAAHVVAAQRGMPAECVTDTGIELAERGFGRQLIGIAGDWSSDPQLNEIFEMQLGWPSLALVGQHRVRSAFTPRYSETHTHWWAISIGDWTGLGFAEIQILPLRPLWPGFAINTLFYAAILWLLVAAPFALRRRLRLRRGHCPHCAYPIGSSQVCTECGRPLHAWSRLRDPDQTTEDTGDHRGSQRRRMQTTE